jgi:hypothetical protein
MSIARLRSWSLPIACAAATAALLVAIAYGSQFRRGPSTLPEVVQAADRMGLYHYAEPGPGSTLTSLILSETPLTREQIQSLWLGHLGDPSWAGCLYVVPRGNVQLMIEDPAPTALWGEMLVYGDPDLARRLLYSARAVSG